MGYTKTQWTDNVTPVSAANLNNLETQYDAVMAAADTNPTPNTIAKRGQYGELLAAFIDAMSKANGVFNPTFNYGTLGWSGADSSTGWYVQYGANIEGGYLYNVANNTSSTNYEWVTSQKIPVIAGQFYTLSVEIYTGGVTAGTVGVVASYYDSSDNFITNFDITANNQTDWTRYKNTNTAPANSSYATVACYVGSNTTNSNVSFRRLKFENGHVATPFSDDTTLSFLINASLTPFLRIDSGAPNPQIVQQPVTFQSGEITIRTDTSSSSSDTGAINLGDGQISKTWGSSFKINTQLDVDGTITAPSISSSNINGTNPKEFFYSASLSLAASSSQTISTGVPANYVALDVFYNAYAAHGQIVGNISFDPGTIQPGGTTYSISNASADSSGNLQFDIHENTGSSKSGTIYVQGVSL